MRAPDRDQPTVSVDELRRAWGAVREGHFRADHRDEPTPDPAHIAACAPRWTPQPDERVLPVIGCGGSVGATVTAIALAEAATRLGGFVRVVECAPASSSGLAVASHHELGLKTTRWLRGTRGDVVLERGSTTYPSARHVPVPTEVLHGGSVLTVLDAGWPPGPLLQAPGWLADCVRSTTPRVLVTSATVSGLRQLEGLLDVLGHEHCVVANVGPSPSRWPTQVRQSVGARLDLVLEADRMVTLPVDKVLCRSGLDGRPLPARLVQQANELLALTSPNWPEVNDDALPHPRSTLHLKGRHRHESRDRQRRR